MRFFIFIFYLIFRKKKRGRLLFYTIVKLNKQFLGEKQITNNNTKQIPHKNCHVAEKSRRAYLSNELVDLSRSNNKHAETLWLSVKQLH